MRCVAGAGLCAEPINRVAYSVPQTSSWLRWKKITSEQLHWYRPFQLRSSALRTQASARASPFPLIRIHSIVDG